MLENKPKDEFLDEIKLAFHSWKNENPVTKLVFEYLRKTSCELTSSLLNLAELDCPNDQKLMLFYIISSKIKVITEITNINLSTLGLMRDELIPAREEEQE